MTDSAAAPAPAAPAPDPLVLRYLEHVRSGKRLAARTVISKLQPGRLQNPHHEKFPAYYRWTTGPTQKAIKRYESVGFQVESWSGAYGHGYYRVLPPLDALERAKSRFLLKHPVPALTSFAAVVLRKPA